MALFSRSAIRATRTAVPVVVRASLSSARDRYAAGIRAEVKDRLAVLSVGSKEMYLQQISEGENMINEGLALVMQGRTGLETVARTEVAEQEMGVLISEVDLRTIRERLQEMEYFPQAGTDAWASI